MWPSTYGNYMLVSEVSELMGMRAGQCGAYGGTLFRDPYPNEPD